MIREGLEMALIVAIVLAYLKTMGRERDFGSVWKGVAAAAVVALAAGIAVFAAVGSLEGRAEEITEGVVALSAAAVLTWMVFWMRRQARTMSGELRAKVDEALASGSTTALAGIAFFAILREGLETALFFLSASVGSASSAQQVAGGFAGLAVASAGGFLIYRGSRKINLRAFFQVTGALVLLFAAGLLAKGIHEFQEAGLIGTFREHVWSLGGWLESGGVHDFAKALFGWSPNPSIEMVGVYVLYLVPVGYAFFSGTSRVPAAPPAVRQPEGAGSLVG
jgi:high-affinity iron transporter